MVSMISMRAEPLHPRSPRRRLARAATRTGLTVALLSVAGTGAANAQAPPTGWQHITNAVSNLCLGVRGVDRHTAGTGSEVFHCNPGGADRGLDNHWRFEALGNGFVRIRNRVSQLCLGVRGLDRHGPGTEVEAYHCTARAGDPLRDSHWRLVAAAGGFFTIHNRVTNLCLGVRGRDAHGPGTGVEVFTCSPGGGDSGRDNLWRFASATATPPPPPPPPGGTTLPPELLAGLTAHNADRANHCAPALTWSATLAAAAAQHANRCSRAHDDPNRGSMGENLAWGTNLTLQASVAMWYSEERLYNYANPVFSPSTGHFTQIVWRSNTQVGCAMARCGTENYWVCRYTTGNVTGQFAQNVLPRTCRAGVAPAPRTPEASPPGVPAPAAPPAPSGAPTDVLRGG